MTEYKEGRKKGRKDGGWGENRKARSEESEGR
jgi:hypothetical protein